MDDWFICFYMRNRPPESMEIFPHTFLRPFAHEEVKTMNEFKFYCSHCDQPLKCDPCHAGRQIQCPGCNVFIRIPSPPPGTGFTHVEPQSGHTWDTHPPKGQKG
jgi:hypothetical protein